MSQSNSTFFWDSETRPVDYGIPAGYADFAEPLTHQSLENMRAAHNRAGEEQVRFAVETPAAEFAQMMLRAQQHRNVHDWFEFLGERPSTQEMMDKFGETTEY